MVAIQSEFDLAKGEAAAILDGLGQAIGADARQALAEAYAKVKVKGLLPREALGMPDELMEVAYQYAYNLFQSGKYPEALPIFTVLHQLDPLEARYLFAVAATHHQLKDYLEAAAHYMIYKYLDPLNPVVSYHLYDCYMQAGYQETALYMLQEAIILCARDARYRELEGKARLEMAHWPKSGSS